MGKQSQPSAGDLLDSLGRKNNRKLADKTCPQCNKLFRPYKAESRYCSRPCMWANNGGHNIKDESWWVNSKGYIEGRVLINGEKIRVKKHRFIIESHLGRSLLPHEDVHHVNGNKTDNRLENLEVIHHSEHTREHNLSRTYKQGYQLNLSHEERNRRSERMKETRKSAIKKATQ